MSDALASALRRQEALAACREAARAAGHGHPFALLRDGPGVAGFTMMRRLHRLGDPACLPGWGFALVFRSAMRGETVLALGLAGALADRRDLLTRDARETLSAEFGTRAVRAAVALRPSGGVALGAGADRASVAAIGLAAVHAALHRNAPDGARWLRLLDGEPPAVLAPSSLARLVEAAVRLLGQDDALPSAKSCIDARRWA